MGLSDNKKSSLIPERAAGALWALSVVDGRAVLVPDAQQRDCLDAEHGGWSWLHFALSDQRGRRFLERWDLLPEPVKQILGGAEHRLQVRASGDWVYGVLPDIERDFDGHALDIGRLYFAFNQTFLITSRKPALRGVDDVRRSVEHGAEVQTAVDVIVLLVERFIDLTEERQQHLSGELDSMEDRVLAMKADPSALQVGPARRELSRQHREFLGLRSAFQHSISHRGQAQTHALASRLPALIQQLEDFDRDAVDLLERARLLHEEIGEQVNAAANRSLRVLTILSTLMMPPTLIVGAFGMNLEGIPWSHDLTGFGVACGLCVLTVGLAYLMLKGFKIL